jgi:hypothetical protein
MNTLARFCFWLFLCAGTCLAQVASNVDTAKGAAQEQAKGSSFQDKEIAVLKAQLDQMKFNDQRMLSTVYWALGLLGTITVAIVGFGWFANFKVYERDKDAMKAALQQEVRKEIDALNKSIEKQITTSISQKTAALKSAIEELTRDLNWLQLENAEREAEEHKSRGVLSNAVRTLAKALNIALGIGYEWKIAAILDKLKKAFDSMAEKGSSIDASLTQELMQTLDKVPASFEVSVNALGTRLGALHGSR